MSSPGSMGHLNSHSTGAVNNIGQSVVDFGIATSPGIVGGGGGGSQLGDRSYSPLPRKCFCFV